MIFFTLNTLIGAITQNVFIPSRNLYNSTAVGMFVFGMEASIKENPARIFFKLRTLI